MKQAMSAIPATLGAFRLEEALRGFNVSTQYASVLSYESQIVEEVKKIKVEIGFREPLLLDAVVLEARTLLLNPSGPASDPLAGLWCAWCGCVVGYAPGEAALPHAEIRVTTPEAVALDARVYTGD